MGLDGVSFTNESSTDFDLRGDYRLNDWRDMTSGQVKLATV